MVTLAVIVIIAAMGFPGLQDIAANNKLMTNTNNLIASFNQARSEALKRATTVQITAKNSDWADGWDVIVNGASIAETAALPSAIELKQFGSIPFATSYTYSAQGRLIISNNNQLHVCDSRTGESGRLITLSPMGRVSVERETCD